MRHGREEGDERKSAGKIARIGGAFVGGTEIQFSENFLKYINTILVKSLNNERDGVPTGHVLSLKKLSVWGLG